MEAHQQRVIDEAAALRGNLDRLIAFLGTPKCAQLGKVEADALAEQAQHMTSYLIVLQQRIARFAT